MWFSIPRNGRRGSFSTGWSTFANENNLRVGDVCVFEPIKSDDVVLKVSILGCTDAAPEPSHPRLMRRDAATQEGRR